MSDKITNLPLEIMDFFQKNITEWLKLFDTIHNKEIFPQ